MCNLETNRLILRPWLESDAEELFKYAKDPRVGPIAGWPVHRSVSESKDIIKDVLSAPNMFAIVLKETNLPIGSIGLMKGKQSNLDISETEAEVGYWIGVPHWRKGFITEAINKVVEYAFEKLSLEKLWCGYYEGNIKSKGAQEKVGFTYQYTLKEVPVPLVNVNDIRNEAVTSLSFEEWSM